MIIPYDYQQKNIDDVRNFIMKKKGNVLTYAPTGAGKSVMIGGSAIGWHNDFPNVNSLILASRKELLSQNFETIKLIDPTVDAGLYSSGLGMKQNDKRIVVAGIQSIFKKAELFAHIDLVYPDEAHNLDLEEKGMYRSFLKDLIAINPHLRVSGYTASPFRTKNGYIFGKDRFFNECLETKSIPELISMGKLSALVSYSESVGFNFKDFHIKRGDFDEKELNEKYSSTKKVEQVCNDILRKTKERKHCIVFAISIEHAELMKRYLAYMGENVEIIHSKIKNRDEVLENFKLMKTKYLINVDILTEGYDAKFIDAVALVRPTMSPGLYLQIAGRGMRVFPGKKDCLFLDYGNNIQRHGCIDDINIKEPCKKPSKEGEAPVRECPDCGVMLHTKIAKCPNCGFVFPYTHEITSSKDSVLTKPKIIDVVNCVGGEFLCKSGKKAYKISFMSSFTKSIDAFFFPEGDPNLIRMSNREWVKIFGCNMPNTLKGCRDIFPVLRKPEQLEIIKSNKYWKILKRINKKGEG